MQKPQDEPSAAIINNVIKLYTGVTLCYLLNIPFDELNKIRGIPQTQGEKIKARLKKQLPFNPVKYEHLLKEGIADMKGQLGQDGRVSATVTEGVAERFWERVKLKLTEMSRPPEESKAVMGIQASLDATKGKI